MAPKVKTENRTQRVAMGSTSRSEGLSYQGPYGNGDGERKQGKRAGSNDHAWQARLAKAHRSLRAGDYGPIRQANANPFCRFCPSFVNVPTLPGEGLIHQLCVKKTRQLVAGK